MTRILITLILAFSLQTAIADVLLIDEVRQSNKMSLPVNGNTKASVESQFGAPVKKHAAIGDPPITRWDYEKYSVYFEHDLVLFSVLNAGAVIEK
jgi:hypothetical protein